MSEHEAFYLPRGDDEYDSTPATASPWDADAQHGGPPAALLAGALMRTNPDPDLVLARIGVDMLGRIPQGRVRTEARVVRPGRRVEMVEGRLLVDDDVAVTATAWRVRRVVGATADVADAPAPLPDVPAEGPAGFFPGVPDDWGYGRAVEWRFVEGGYGHLGDARVWTRVRIPLIADREIDGLERLLVVADSANGLSIRLPLDEWWSIPPTANVTIQRVPAGEWTFVEAATRLGPDGRGMARATMSDLDGVLADVAQPLMVAPR